MMSTAATKPKLTAWQKREQDEKLSSQCVEDVFAGRAAFDGKIWRMTDGTRAPWHFVAKRNWKSVRHIMLHEHRRILHEAEALERNIKHDLDWQKGRDDDRVCDGCTELHYVDVLGKYDEVNHCPTVIRRDHVPHLNSAGVDEGLHHFHISTAEWNQKCDAYLAARDRIPEVRADLERFYREVLNDHPGAATLYETLDEESRGLLVASLVMAEAGTLEEKAGVSLTAKKMREIVRQMEERIQRDLDGIAGKLEFDFCSREQREESLASARPRLAVCRWLLANREGAFAKEP